MNPAKTVIHLGQNILAGTRMALFMPVYLWSFRASYIQLLLLLVISFGLSCVYEFFDTSPDNYFNIQGLGYQAVLYLAFFFSLSFIAHLNNRLQDLTKLLILFLSIVPVIWLGTVCLLYLSELQSFLTLEQSGWFVFILYLGWYAVVVFRIIRRFFYLNALKTSLYVLFYCIINFLPLFILPAEPLWDYKKLVYNTQSKAEKINIESTYYFQDEIINLRMQDLLPGKNDIDDLYFIGFAGDAEEDVFMNEAIAAKKIIDSHYGAYNRSTLLINNRKSINQYPLANQHNLSRIINRIAGLMELENDVLFLFITSHGSEDHKVSVNFPRFNLNNIDAGSIKKSLDTAGIKWRIIVISACYSGGLIDVLNDPYTLIITAANNDRASFGCGHDGTYTYFGKAFFEDSLRQYVSITKAFEKAKELIYERENAEAFTNSEPQISMGIEMKEKLMQLEIQLEQKNRTNWATTYRE